MNVGSCAKRKKRKQIAVFRPIKLSALNLDLKVTFEHKAQQAVRKVSNGFMILDKMQQYFKVCSLPCHVVCKNDEING